ncbi:MAG: tetratricopeptide repeat protein [Pseudomonadota bacterium]
MFGRYSLVDTVLQLRYLYLVLISLWLTACGINPTPPQVEDRTTQPPVERAGEPPAAEVKPRQTTSAATASLLAAAEQASADNQHKDAIAYLERAVRIEPRDATLWLRLSAAYLANRELDAAAQHTRKAIALARDPDLQRDAWLQLAEIEQARGNFSEAQALRRQWQAVRS